MNDNMPIIRIVTTSTMPAKVAPRVSQWANGHQPLQPLGLHVQARSERGVVTLEAVCPETGELEASASNIVALMKTIHEGRLGFALRTKGLKAPYWKIAA